MDILQTIDEHIIIRETVGYGIIEQLEVWDIPEMMKFLKIVHNYEKMTALNEKTCT